MLFFRKKSVSEMNRKKNKLRTEFIRHIIPKFSIGAEIGVHKGQFSRILLQEIKPLKLHLIDPWYMIGDKWSWGSGDRSTLNALDNIKRLFYKEILDNVIVLNVGFDLDILGNFPDSYFDWVYLDTTHQYEHTKKELLLLNKKVKNHGLILGDDWNPSPKHEHYGVYKAVNEFIEIIPYKLIYSNNINKQWAITKKQDCFY